MSEEETITLVLTYSEVTMLIQAVDYKANREADLADVTTSRSTERIAREESAKHKLLAARLADLLTAHEAGQMGEI